MTTASALPTITLPLELPETLALEGTPTALSEAFQAFKDNTLPLYALLGHLMCIPHVPLQDTLPPVLFATVEGDVHEVGKHLAQIFMTAFGRPFEDLGTDVAPNTIQEALTQKPYTAVVVSGLLYEGANRMRELAQCLQRAGCTTPLIIASCGMNADKTHRFIQSEYPNAPVMFAPHALGTLQWITYLQSQEGLGLQSSWHTVGRPQCPPAPDTDILVYAQSPEDLQGDAPPECYTQRNTAVRALPSNERPTPPFWGFKTVKEIDLQAIYPFVNARTLYTGHWGFRRGERRSGEFQTYLETHAAPILEALKADMLQKEVLKPTVIYGYTPCRSEGNQIHVYHPEKPESLWHTFQFPRGGTKALCLSDYISQEQDVMAWQIVTMGTGASEYLKQLLNSKQYQAYYTCHGFFVEMAEALAEYWHSVVRRELNIHHADATDMQAILSMDGGYQGCRYSFGYPACPDMREQHKLFEMLNPEQIGIRLTRNWMQDPEQTTCALIFHHPEAHYFDVRQWQS
jgi:5-methyltetrahydrofolate--homocysteine methyltransferase